MSSITGYGSNNYQNYRLGTTNASGASGTSGASGAEDASGAENTSGAPTQTVTYQATAKAKGTNVCPPSDASGASGTSGASGALGSSGASGASGVGGASGASGAGGNYFADQIQFLNYELAHNTKLSKSQREDIKGSIICLEIQASIISRIDEQLASAKNDMQKAQEQIKKAKENKDIFAEQNAIATYNTSKDWYEQLETDKEFEFNVGLIEFESIQQMLENVNG